MKFRLIYKGLLYSNGPVDHKHDIRKKLHPQLKKLWNCPPLSHRKTYKEALLAYPPWPDNVSVIRKVGDFFFAPLVCADLDIYAEIDITLLRPGPLGKLITQGGDIDNRLKTLFDALRYPKEKQELSKKLSLSFKNPKTPFFCLLEDDQLIHKVSVSVDRLLLPVKKDEVYITLLVKIRGIVLADHNMPMLGS